jgi:hypothetical protein
VKESNITDIAEKAYADKFSDFNECRHREKRCDCRLAGGRLADQQNESVLVKGRAGIKSEPAGISFASLSLKVTVCLPGVKSGDENPLPPPPKVIHCFFQIPFCSRHI